MMNGLSGFAPTAAALFLALCVLWLVWRAFRRLLRSPDAERREPPFAPESEFAEARREPALGPVPSAGPAVPDAADILALKASIDALTKQVGDLEKQIGTLEKRLAVANSNVPAPVEQAPPAQAKARLLDALAEVPLIVPDRRR